MRKQKRRGMSIEVKKRFMELLKADYSVTQIYDKLVEEFGEADETDGMVSDRTIRQYVKKFRPPDPSGPWSLADDNEGAAFLLAVLGAVVDHTEGRKTGLTRKEAEWIERIKQGAPDIPPITAYWFTRAYIFCESKGQDVAHLDMALALSPTEKETAAVLPETELNAVKARIALHLDLHLRLWPGRQLVVWPRVAWISEEYVEAAKSRGATMLVWSDGFLSPAILEIVF